MYFRGLNGIPKGLSPPPPISVNLYHKTVVPNLCTTAKHNRNISYLTTHYAKKNDN